ncbi:hypothetical protein [Vagococcus fluvialis]|uniref:hypothetical protein n=1 Tax=Vagococcus fluvialis TaxID=2738 RepID=UPI001D0AFA63|nr:hypothetical protein [Vagococcus fluvialis]UDM73273.1 hypothetical protein K5K99_10080 [Vagococcus fluvialis]
MVEYNFLGPSRNQIEEFLTSYINNVDDNIKYEIKLYEILKDPMLALIPNSDSIKSVTLTLNNEGFNLGNLFNEISEERERLFEKLFEGPVDVANEMDVNQTTIVLKKGRKNKEMNINQIGEILNLININSTELVSAIVEFKNPRTNELERFNLKHDGFYTGYITSETYSAFDILAELLTRHYYDDKSRNKDNYYTRYNLINFNQEEFTLEYPEDDFGDDEQE